MGDIYGKPAIVVDTHCIRITNRIGLVAEKDPKKIEFALKRLFLLRKARIFAIGLFFSEEISALQESRFVMNAKCGKSAKGLV